VVTAPVVVETAPKRRLKVAAVTFAPVPEWLQDEALRGMVIENSDCFGAWSAKSSACGECILAGWCRNAKAAALTLLATKIKVVDPNAPTPVTDAVANLDAAVGAANAPSAGRTVPNPEGDILTAAYDCLCGETGKAIKKGARVRYIRGKGLVLAT
jgi:hypothetical protein